MAQSVIPSLPQLIAAYRGGESLKSISDRIGFSRGAIGRRFAMAGAALRSQSDSEGVKWRIIKQSDAGITRQLSKAWNARSGKVDPLSRKIARSGTRFLRQTHIGRDETLLAAELIKRGATIVQQFPVGPYNLDIAFDKSFIAVEVQSSGMGCASSRSSASTDRVEYILNSGWRIVFIAGRTGRHAIRFNDRAIADKLIAFFKRASGDKSLIGKYGVILSHGKRSAGSCAPQPPAPIECLHSGDESS